MLDDNQSWRSAKLSGEVTSYLDSNRDLLQKVAGQLAKNRLVEAYRSVKTFVSGCPKNNPPITSPVRDTTGTAR